MSETSLSRSGPAPWRRRPDVQERAARRLTGTVFALSVLLFAGAFAFSIGNISSKAASSWGTSGVVGSDLLAASTFSFALVGAFISFRQPRNRIAWIFLGIGLAWGADGFLSNYLTYGFDHPGSLPRPDVAVALDSWLWIPAIGLIALLILLFPDGRIPSPRWRILAWVCGFTLVFTSIAVVFRPGSLADSGFPNLDNPLGIEPLAPLLQALQFALALIPICLLAAAIGLIQRYRRSSGVERLQLKWLASAAAIVALIYLIAMAASFSHVQSEAPFWVLVVQDIALFSFALIPTAAGLAILKYRLYDIDVVINKTLVFGALGVFISAVYIAIVVGVGALVGQGDAPNLGLSIAATAVVAVAFQPVREWAQRSANQLVYGERATPYEVMARFSHDMAAALAVEEVLPATAKAAAQGIGAAGARVTVYLPHGERSASWPSDNGISSFDTTVPAVYKAEPVGAIEVAKPPGEVVTPGEHKLLEDLASQAGLALHNSRLALELRARLDQISAQAEDLKVSRVRIVTAAGEASRSIERAIHDGPEVALEGMAEELDTTMVEMRRDPRAAALALDDLASRVNETLDRLRDIARGIYPPLLADKGLVPALEALIRKSGRDVRFAHEGMTDARFDEAVESAIYFCLREAIGVIDAHGAASLDLQTHSDSIVFDIAVQVDDPDEIRESLVYMGDRVAALDGSLEVDREATTTTIRARVPAAALEPTG